MPEPTLADLFAVARTLLEGGLILDPAYDALRSVLFDAKLVTKNGGNRLGSYAAHPVSYWQQAPDGALEGALIKALLGMGIDPNDAILDSLVDLVAFMGDTRIPAMQTFVAWLKVTDA